MQRQDERELLKRYAKDGANHFDSFLDNLPEHWFWSVKLTTLKMGTRTGVLEQLGFSLERPEEFGLWSSDILTKGFTVRGVDRENGRYRDHYDDDWQVLTRAWKEEIRWRRQMFPRRDVKSKLQKRAA